MIQSFEKALILELPSEKQEEGIISLLAFGRCRSALMRYKIAYTQRPRESFSRYI